MIPIPPPAYTNIHRLSKQELCIKQMRKDVKKMNPFITKEMRDEIKQMRDITGLDIELCKLSIIKRGNMEDAIAYLRSMSDEPEYKVLTATRWDVVDEQGHIVFSCKDMNRGRCNIGYRIRFVDSVGFYSYLR